MIKNFINISMLGLILLMSQTSCENEESLTGTPESTIIPIANFSATADLFQADQKISFTDLSTDEDGFITGWDWDFGDGSTSTEQAPEHFYSIGENYVVTLKVADNTGSYSEVHSKELNIEDNPLTNLPEPQELWNYELPSVTHHTSPAVMADGTVIVGCNLTESVRKAGDFPENLFAIKMGTKVWGTALYENNDATDTDEIRSSPSIGPDGSVYSSSYYSRQTFKIDSSSGEIKEVIYLNTRVRYTCPTFGPNGEVYVAGYEKDGKGFHSLNTSLTSANWVFKSGTQFNATPAIGSDGTLYIGANDGFFYAIDSEGNEKWSVNYGSETASATAIGPDGTVYFSGESGNIGVLYAFDPDDGAVKWYKNLNKKASQGGPAISADGTIYLGGYEEKMIAYNPEDGSEKWSYTAKGAIETVPAIDDAGNLYFGDLSGYFHVVGVDGKPKYKPLMLGDLIHDSAAIGADGTVYVTANSSTTSKPYALEKTATGLQTGG